LVVSVRASQSARHEALRISNGGRVVDRSRAAVDRAGNIATPIVVHTLGCGLSNSIIIRLHFVDASERLLFGRIQCLAVNVRRGRGRRRRCCRTFEEAAQWRTCLSVTIQVVSTTLRNHRVLSNVDLILTERTVAVDKHMRSFEQEGVCGLRAQCLDGQLSSTISIMDSKFRRGPGEGVEKEISWRRVQLAIR